MIGTEYWSVGITVHARAVRNGPGLAWAGELKFYDAGWVDDDDAATGKVCTEGALHTRYHVDPAPGDDGSSALTAVIDVLIADAARLGITFTRHEDNPPIVSYKGDGEWESHPPPEGWRDMLSAQSKRLGWYDCYAATQAGA
jgi:hypothetical protein